MNGVDWACDSDDRLVVAPSGEIEVVGRAEAVLQAFLHELKQPIASMPWDVAEDSIENEAEGSYLPLFVDQDLSLATPLDIQREITRLSRKARYASDIASALLTALVIDGNSYTASIALTVIGEEEIVTGSVIFGGNS